MTNVIMIINGGCCTSYIVATIIALFYKSTCLECMLSIIPDNINFLYLQDLINNNIIDPLRHNYSIDYDVINEIRNYCITCGWLPNCNPVLLHDISKFIDFLFSGLKNSMHHNMISIKNIGNTIISCDLLDTWYKNHQPLTLDNPTPSLIMITLDKNHHKNNLDIMKKIKFNNCNVTWSIHALLCLSKSHYYALIYLSYHHWIIFDETTMNAISEINIMGENINKIKNDCVAVLYKIDDVVEICG